MKANASKHKAMSYDRMREKQRQLRDEVKQLLAQAEAADAAEDAEYGADRRGDELPAELQRRESRLKRIREAKRALEARAKDEAAAAGQPTDSAKPDPKAQYNFTDPESRIMKGPDGFVQAYNVQVAVDELQLIVGQAVTQETNDKKQLMPMITTIEQQSGDHAHAAARRRRLLLGRELDRDRRHAHRRVHLDAEAETWRAAGALSARARCRRPRRSSTGCPASCTRKVGAAVYARAQSDRRTGDWPDQAGAWLPAILVARIREGARRMVAGVHDAQHSQAVSPLRVSRHTRPPSPRAGTDILGAQHEEP